MTSNKENTENRTVGGLLLLCVLSVCVGMFLIPVPGSKEAISPPPPDLSRCTRLEIRCLPSTFDFVTEDGHYAYLLDPTE